jgi:hypothetical protein
MMLGNRHPDERQPLARPPGLTDRYGVASGPSPSAFCIATLRA